MNRLIIFKGNYVNLLRSSIRENLDKYLKDESWLIDDPGAPAHEISSSLEISNSFQLLCPTKESLRDTENALLIHRALPHLTPLQARDARLWTRLCHIDFWHYMRARWDVGKHIEDSIKSVRFIDARYFVSQSQSRSLIRNGIARLWWTAHLSYDERLDNPYALTDVLLSNLDITQQILERSMGRAENVLKGFLSFLTQNKATFLTGGNKNRERIRSLAKFLNRSGGVLILDCLEKNEIVGMLEKEHSRQLLEETEEVAEG